MTKTNYLKMLVEVLHSTTVATIGPDGHPQTRIIDMMHYDEDGVYFLTAKGKAFYAQLMEQKYVAISATKDKVAVSLAGLNKLLFLKKQHIIHRNKQCMYWRVPAILSGEFRFRGGGKLPYFFDA